MRHEIGLRHAAPSDGASYDFSGTWINELGSTMTLSMNGDQLTGAYLSQVSGGGPPAQGNVTGWASGYLISVTVDWVGLASISSWVGQVVIVDYSEVIATLWQMTMAISPPEQSTELWQSVLAGSDTFTRQQS
jgi:hypothetical protein